MQEKIKETIYKIIYILFLPMFFIFFVLMQVFEGLIWLWEYPRSAWLYIKETLGIGGK